MRYEIYLEKRVIKEISSYPPKHQSQLKQKIIALQENPYPSDSKDLKGFAPCRRCDSGEYRIVYWVEKRKIRVVLVGKRNDGRVFAELKRLIR